MTDAKPTTANVFHEGAVAYLRVQLALNESAEAEWQAGMTPQPREDTSERSKGMTNDPVFVAVSDERRIALRVAADSARKAQAQYVHTLLVAERKLARALAGEI